MSLRELIVLGTASQVPTRHRNHNGYFLRWDSEGFMFDPGEGTQRQMIHYGVTASSITNVCLTHFHGDHCLGFASLVQRISLDNVPHQVDAFYPASGETFYRRLRKASIFHDVAKIRPRPIPKGGMESEGSKLSIRARPLDHTVDCFGYRIQESDQWRFDQEKLEARGLRGPVVGRIQRDGQAEVDGEIIRVEDVGSLQAGQSMAFVMDTRVCDEAIELARGVDMLVIESTYLNSEATEARNNGHLTAREAAEIAHEAGARRLVLTHFSQRYTEVEPFLEEASAIHSDVTAAVDGDRIPVPKRIS